MHEISTTPDLAADRLALSQRGVLSRAQALASGMSEDAIYRRLRSGRWEKVFPSVYRVSGAERSWLQNLTAALLWAGPRSVTRGRSAGALWELDGCPEGAIELFHIGRRGKAPSGITVRCTDRLEPSDVTSHKGLTVTTPTRTLLDLATVLDRDHLEIALEDALRRRLTSVPRLRWMLDTQARRLPGAKPLRRLIDLRDDKQRATDSWLEAKLFPLLRKARLPAPEPGVDITEGGRFVARPDFVYPDARLIIEAHSYRFHSGRQAWDKDVQRDKKLRRLGWRLLYLTYEDIIKRPEQVVADIRAALRDPTLFT